MIVPSTQHYLILGVPVSVTSDLPEALERVDACYSTFRDNTTVASKRTIALQLHCSVEDATYLVSDLHGQVQPWSNRQAAVRDLLEHIDRQVMMRFQKQGIAVGQTSALAYAGGAVILTGRSGSGKTTLALGLLRRGLQLLSDEVTLIEQLTYHVVPYRRSMHVRCGTIELVPELRVLQELASHHTSGEGEWLLAPHLLEYIVPDCLGDAAPLRAVLVLQGVPRASVRPTITPLSPALAAMETLQGTWATAEDDAERLQDVGRLLESARCARLQVGKLEETLDCLESWLAQI